MFIEINRNNKIPVKKQLYDALTFKFLNGEIDGGSKLPSTRKLSDELNISRSTILEIYEQLIAEGYLYSSRGSGTYVSENIKTNRQKSEKVRESGKRYDKGKDLISLIAGTPDLDSFPYKAWEKAFHTVLLRNDREIYDYGNDLGYFPLRETLCDYLVNHKGIRCAMDQIIITSGTKDSMNIIASSLKSYFNTLISEYPCVDFIEPVFKAGHYHFIKARVDNEGLVVSSIDMKSPSLIYASPSHQFPLGGTLSIARRQALVEFAEKYDHVILEDDYDSEFRYRGAPINSLFQLNSDRVIHIGTFSKTLCPSLRIGYMVLPVHLIKSVRIYFEKIGNFPCTLNQAVLNEIIMNGSYEKHVYRMTRQYKSKMTILCKTLREKFGKDICINGEFCGLHLVVSFRDCEFSELDRTIFMAEGLEVDFPDDYLLEEKVIRGNKLIVGFGYLTHEEIVTAVNRLEKAINRINGIKEGK